MNKGIKLLAIGVLCTLLSACLPDGDLGDKAERQTTERTAQASGLARSLSVVASQGLNAFLTNNASPFKQAVDGGTLADLDTMTIDLQSMFALNLGPASTIVRAGYCADNASDTDQSLVVWLNQKDGNNVFAPVGLGQGATGAVMAQLARMNNPSSVGVLDNNAIRLSDGNTLNLGACAGEFTIPIGAPVMVFANLQETNVLTAATLRTETQTLACRAGQTGTITQRRTVDVPVVGAEVPGPWTTVASLCFDTAQVNASTAVNTTTTGLLSNLAANIGNPQLRDALNSLNEQECKSTIITKTEIDPESGQPRQVSYDTCSGEARVSAISDLEAIPLGEPTFEPLIGPCSASTVGIIDQERPVNIEGIPITLDAIFSASIYGPNDGASYQRKIQNFRVKQPDGTFKEVTLRDSYTGVDLNCSRSERVVIDADQFLPDWAAMGVDVNDLVAIPFNTILNVGSVLPDSITRLRTASGAVFVASNATLSNDIARALEILSNSESNAAVNNSSSLLYSVSITYNNLAQGIQLSGLTNNPSGAATLVNLGGASGNLSTLLRNGAITSNATAVAAIENVSRALGNTGLGLVNVDLTKAGSNDLLAYYESLSRALVDVLAVLSDPAILGDANKLRAAGNLASALSNLAAQSGYSIDTTNGAIMIQINSIRGLLSGANIRTSGDAALTGLASAVSDASVTLSDILANVESGIVYTRTANVRGFADPVALTPNTPSFTPYVLESIAGAWLETKREDIICDDGNPGTRTSRRTHKLTGFRTVVSSGFDVSTTCRFGNINPSCTEVTEMRGVACPNPDEAGLIEERRIVNQGNVCGADTAWTVFSNTCTAICTPTTINGVCGSANGVETATAPSGGALCASGSASTVSSNAGSFTWACNGSGAPFGTMASCSAPKPSVPPSVCTTGPFQFESVGTCNNPPPRSTLCERETTQIDNGTVCLVRYSNCFYASAANNFQCQ